MVSIYKKWILREMDEENKKGNGNGNFTRLARTIKFKIDRTHHEHEAADPITANRNAVQLHTAVYLNITTYVSLLRPHRVRFEKKYHCMIIFCFHFVCNSKISSLANILPPFQMKQSSRTHRPPTPIPNSSDGVSDIPLFSAATCLFFAGDIIMRRKVMSGTILRGTCIS